ncbi:MAG: hypothetical protein WBE05_22780, partial [Pseudolabrys sp.]
ATSEADLFRSTAAAVRAGRRNASVRHRKTPGEGGDQTPDANVYRAARAAFLNTTIIALHSSPCNAASTIDASSCRSSCSIGTDKPSPDVGRPAMARKRGFA